MVPDVDEVVAVTAMHVLLLSVCMLRECEGASLTVMLVWGMDEVWSSASIFFVFRIGGGMAKSDHEAKIEHTYMTNFVCLFTNICLLGRGWGKMMYSPLLFIIGGQSTLLGVVSAGHVGSTRGSGILSSAADVLWMSVVRRMRGVDGVCELCMCLAWAAWV